MMEINLLKRAMLADIAYEPDPKIMNVGIKELIDYEDIINIEIKSTDTEGAIVRVNEDKCIILFPGTESFKDLLIDLLAVPVHYELGGLLHKGFNMVYEELKKVLVTMMFDLYAFRDPEILFIGHSLGAQCALLSADDLLLRGFRRMEITTFGCPNGWNEDAAKMYERRHKNTKVLHVKNVCDYVMALIKYTTTRPFGKKADNIMKLEGKWGHSMGTKYIPNIKELYTIES